MQVSVLSSTFFLTLLLAVGLFFFIRASAKDRTQVAKLIADQQRDTLLEQLQRYFAQRSYRIASVDSSENRVTFEGFVRPSVFLAIFLSVLAGIGILCLVLVLAQLFPDWAPIFSGLLVLSPLAGIFYWRRAGRPEQVFLSIEAVEDENQINHSLVTVTAHRDELIELRRSLPLKAVEDVDE
ncbi:MAG: cofactor assembly of complex C subunit B [Elainellaceae cyanobacterium]